MEFSYEGARPPKTRERNATMKPMLPRVRMPAGAPRAGLLLSRLAGVQLLLLLFTGCATHPDYATQFRFPVEWGSIEAGRQTFVALQCHRCHSVNGVALPAFEGESPVRLELGGEIAYVKTYADLVTSIVNPNHVLSDEYLRQLPPGERRAAQSVMPFNEQMTVAQLIDLVTFLNSRYVLIEGYSEIYYR